MPSTYNGMEIGKVYSTKLRPKKKDNGHSIVEIRTVVNTRWVTRRTIICQCGKKMSGNGQRALYSHNAHIKQVTAE